MPIRSARLILAALLAAGATAGGVAAPAQALDAIAALKANPVAETQAAFGSVKEALRAGVRDYHAGNKLDAAKAWEFAAGQGNALALWKLGRMYADGDGVVRNDLKAFELFARVADENADETPQSPRASLVANAFVSLGTYFLDGIKGSYVAQNPERAAEMFSYAASYFGDPNAQFLLGRLYLDGNGVERDTRQAARWLNLAAEKGHSSAQAMLGQILTQGGGVPRQAVRGLMWLEIAKQTADPKRDAWIADLHEQAFKAASDTERRHAADMSEQFQARRR